MLIGLDPGMNSPGIALFNNQRLVVADRVRGDDFAELPDGERWLRVARALSAWTREHIGQNAPELLTIVFEKPQWYQRGKSKGDPNQLVGVAGVAANYTGVMSMMCQVSIGSPTPAEWIGQLPKVCPVCKGKAKRKCKACLGSAWKTPRGQRIWSHLTEQERPLVPDQNDAIDAVGIGLWAIGRLQRHSVFSNGNDGR